MIFFLKKINTLISLSKYEDNEKIGEANWKEKSVG